MAYQGFHLKRVPPWRAGVLILPRGTQHRSQPHWPHCPSGPSGLRGHFLGLPGLRKTQYQNGNGVEPLCSFESFSLTSKRLLLPWGCLGGGARNGMTFDLAQNGSLFVSFWFPL